MGSDTSIPVSDETWRQLNDRKDRGETYDDVIQGLLETQEVANEC